MSDEEPNFKNENITSRDDWEERETNLANRATAPDTTGEATLVPDNTLQPETRFEPRTSEP